MELVGKQGRIKDFQNVSVSFYVKDRCRKLETVKRIYWMFSETGWGSIGGEVKLLQRSPGGLDKK